MIGNEGRDRGEEKREEERRGGRGREERRGRGVGEPKVQPKPKLSYMKYSDNLTPIYGYLAKGRECRSLCV